ncbi:MAG: DUF6383 domain-containing protein [Parabacteroides sp.]|nr:DUF6383 domain-containing protein [bacterium]MDY4103268.1 DUF6383 domain-containing protein [Parabacteroides sp.]
MNKKFSTLLTAGLLVVGSLFSGASAQTLDKLENHMGDKATKVDGTYYFLVQNTDKIWPDGSSSKPGLAFGMTDYNVDTKQGTGSVIYPTFETTGLDVKAYIWEVKESTSALGTVVTFKNYKTGQYLRATNQEISWDYTKTDATVSNAWLWNTSKTTYEKAAAATVNANKAFLVPFLAQTQVAYVPSAGDQLATNIAFAPSTDPSVTFTLYKVKDFTPDEEKLNDLYNKNGFNFDLTTEGVDNIFASQKIKAIKVANAVMVNDNEGFPAGTYFAVSTPDGDYATTTSQLDYLLNSTFIAVSATDNASSNADVRKAGRGFKLTTVSGKDLNLFISTTQSVIDANPNKVSKGAEISAYNAAFTVAENLAGDRFALSLAKIRYQKETGSDAHAAIAVKLGVMTDLNIVSGKTLTTETAGANNFIFKFAEVSIEKGTALLNATGASIYNIKLASGDAAGAYLTEFNNAYYTKGIVMADLDAPEYQYIITNVNGTDVTFTNRLTRESFTTKLYVEEDGCYSLNMQTPNDINVSVLDLNEANNVVAAPNPYKLNGAHVQLIPAESTEKTNGYLDVEDGTYVTLAFARDYTPTSNKLYPYVDLYDRNNVPTALSTWKMTDDPAEAAQWKLVKNDPVYVTQTYAYLDANDKVIYKTKGDTIAYYTYKFQNVENGEEYNYLTAPTNSYDDRVWRYETLGTKAQAQDFIIKENIDGSVTIMEAQHGLKYTWALFAQNHTNLQINGEEYRGVVPEAIAYRNAKSTDIKTYLVQEALEVTLPVETTYVTMESEYGNYISMDEEYDGILAIREPLTMRVFATDTKKALPSFFISTGYDENVRSFLFNPQDSVNYYVGLGQFNKDYQTFDEDTKAIFKEGILSETADTLITSIKGDVVEVADQADRAGVQAGLKKFKFQIVKVDPEEDWYVIRQGNVSLSAINGKLVFTNGRPLMVKIAETTSPTANEAVAAAEVSVVAVNGAIIVKGAAGKVVTVANILGQTIANQVAASDNVTIAAPAGIAVVTVDGEATKVVVK